MKLIGNNILKDSNFSWPIKNKLRFFLQSIPHIKPTYNKRTNDQQENTMTLYLQEMVALTLTADERFVYIGYINTSIMVALKTIR